MLGDEGMGFKITMDTLDAGRIGIAAQAVGIAKAAHEESVAYVQERRQFGRPVADFQGVQFMLADMATQIEAARSPSCFRRPFCATRIFRVPENRPWPNSMPGTRPCR